MKFLIISDLHGKYSKVEALLEKAGNIAAVIVSGDITNFGPDYLALELIKRLKGMVLAIPGNCDPRSILKIIEKSGAVNLHNSYHKMGELYFLGIGGSSPTPFNTPFEFSESEIERSMEALLKQIPREARKILVSHSPPKGFLDRVPRGNAGSLAIAKYLDRFELIVCGHIHEDRGITRVDQTTIVNPGPASRGYGAVIEVNNAVKVELIDV